jgi:UDP-MurNAc hydroxylase
MKVRYIYSACVVVSTEDMSVCCDPWFTEGVYDGTWYHYPPLADDAVDVIGPVDFIYISHIHPDHYDALFLRQYLKRHPDTRLIIGNTNPPHLLNKARVDGFSPEVTDSLTVGETHLHIIPNSAFEELENIDTALLITRGGQSVLNMNDNPWDPAQLTRIKKLLDGKRPSLLLAPYAGAGAYPQTYLFDDDARQQVAAECKKKQFLDMFTRYVNEFEPVKVMPFAGKYVVAGPHSRLNPLRGVADPLEAAALFPEKAVVLADGGQAVIDLETMEASAVRTKSYDPAVVQCYLDNLDFPGYDYELEIQPLHGRALPIFPLLRTAYERAIANSCVHEPFWICIRPNDLPHYYVLNIHTLQKIELRGSVEDIEPRLEIFIDPRYLFGLLTRLYHWNNAEIGSQYFCRRVPDVFKREVHAFLNYLQV